MCRAAKLRGSPESRTRTRRRARPRVRAALRPAGPAPTMMQSRSMPAGWRRLHRPGRRARARGGDRLGEPAAVDRLAERGHQELQVGEVVQRYDPRAGRLADAEQVVQVGAAVAGGARRARAAVADRLVGVAVAALGQVDPPAPLRVGHDGHAVATDAGRHRAVERVDPELRAAQEVVDVADPQQVARTLLGELLGRPADDLVHLRLVLAERPADGEAERVTGADLLGAPAAQVLVHAALDDRVDALPGGSMLLVPREAAVQPAVGALRAALRVLAGDVEREALVEHERDVGVERRLHGHRRLRPHELLRAVDVGAEADALLVDAEDRAPAGRRAGDVAALDLVGDGAVTHGEDLEAAGVGDHRLVPAHEPVHAAEALDELGPGREEQVERVREHHVVPELAGLGDLERLDHRLGRERDERGRADVAVGQLQRAGAGARAGVTGADREGGRQGRRRKAEGPPERGWRALGWWRSGRGALERPRLLGAGADADPAGLALLGLRDAHLEHPAVELRVHGRRVDALRQREGAGERSEGPLHAVEALALVLVLGLALAGHGQDVVLELDGHVGLRHARQVGAEDELLLGLEQIHRRGPAARGRGVARGCRVEGRVEQPVHLGLEGAQLTERLPAHDGHDLHLLMG